MIEIRIIVKLIQIINNINNYNNNDSTDDDNKRTFKIMLIIYGLLVNNDNNN